MVCARSGINRLRLRAMEQANLASTVSGPASSMSSAIALATSAQARAGAGFLAGKLARLVHRNVASLIPLAGMPSWQLLLNASYKPNTLEKESDVEVNEEEPKNELKEGRCSRLV